MPTDVYSDMPGSMLNTRPNRSHQDANADVDIWTRSAVIAGRGEVTLVDGGHTRFLPGIWVDYHEGGTYRALLR